VDKQAGGRWAAIRSRIIDTPELQEKYERQKRAIVLTRQILMQIDAERERVGISKAELARRMGTTPSVVRRMFSSKSGNPTLRTVLDMLEALGVEIELKPTQEGASHQPASEQPGEC
jgi:DNA-binding phage protein